MIAKFIIALIKVIYVTNHLIIKICWTKLSQFQPHCSFRGYTFVFPQPEVLITYIRSDTYIHGKTFAVLLIIVKTMNVQPSKSFPVYSRTTGCCTYRCLITITGIVKQRLYINILQLPCKDPIHNYIQLLLLALYVHTKPTNLQLYMQQKERCLLLYCITSNQSLWYVIITNGYHL